MPHFAGGKEETKPIFNLHNFMSYFLNASILYMLLLAFYVEKEHLVM